MSAETRDRDDSLASQQIAADWSDKEIPDREDLVLYVAGDPETGPLLDKDFNVVPLVYGLEEPVETRDERVNQQSLERNLLLSDSKEAFHELCRGISGNPYWSREQIEEELGVPIESVRYDYHRDQYKATVEAHQEFEFAGQLCNEHPDLVEPGPHELAQVTSGEPLEIEYKDLVFEIDTAFSAGEVPSFRYKLPHYFYRESLPDKGVEKHPEIVERTVEGLEPPQARLDEFGVNVPPLEREWVSDYNHAFRTVVDALKQHGATVFATGSLVNEEVDKPNDVDIAVKELWEPRGVPEELEFEHADLRVALEELTGEDPRQFHDEKPGGWDSPTRGEYSTYGSVHLYSFELSGVEVQVGFDQYPLQSEFTGEVPEDFRGEVETFADIGGNPGRKKELLAEYSKV